MKLDNLGVATLTSFTPVHPIHGDTGIVIEGHTPDSSLYKTVERKYNPPPKTTHMSVSKRGGNRIEIPTDPNAAEKRIKRLAEIVTNVTGIDDWSFSDESVLTLFQRDDCQWLVDAWEDHLDDRGNY